MYLTERVTLQSPVPAPDGAGGTVRAWEDLAEYPTVSAAVVHQGYAEGIVADRMSATASELFVIRHRSDLDERMRILWQGIPYNIRSVRRARGRRRFLEIVAERGVAS